MRENNVFEDLLSAPQAAIIYGTSESTIKRKIKEGELVNGEDCKNYGKQWLITRNSLNRVFGTPATALNDLAKSRLFGR